MKQTLRDLAEKLGCHLLGDASITVTTVSSLQSATSESVVFVEDNGPAGSIPVPAQPGEGPDIRVGKFSVVVP